MKLFNAEAQSKFMVGQAKLAFMVGCALLIELIFPMAFSLSGFGTFNSFMSGAVLGILLASIIVMIFSAKRTPKKVIYSDEYTLMLDKNSKTWAFLAMIVILGAQVVLLSLIELKVALADLAQFNLSSAFVFYGAKVSWEIYKENKLEQLANE